MEPENNQIPTSVRIRKLVSAAKLKDISLKSINAQSILNPYTVEPQNTVIKRAHSVKVEISSNHAFCFVSYSIEGKKKDDDAAIFTLDMIFCVLYEFEGVLDLDGKDVELFGSTNAFYNAFPFIRETIQNTMQRMNLPVYKLPLLKPPTLKNFDEGLNTSTLIAESAEK